MSLSTTSTHRLNTSRDGDSTTSLGSLFQCLTTLLVKFFLLSNLNLPWCNLRPFPLVLSTCYLREETNSHLATTFFQVVVESDKVSPQSPLLQAKLFDSSLNHSHMTCSPDPSPASLPFSGHAPATQCPSCTEGPKTEHSIQGVAFTSAKNRGTIASLLLLATLFPI